MAEIELVPLAKKFGPHDQSEQVLDIFWPILVSLCSNFFPLPETGTNGIKGKLNRFFFHEHGQ